MADAVDILTEEETAAAINYDLSDLAEHADEVARLVTFVSQRFDKVLGPVVYRNVTERLSHDGTSDKLNLSYAPVASVTTLTEYTPGGATGQVVTLDDEDTFNNYGYLLDGPRGLILRRSGGTPAWWAAGDRNIVVTYVAGRYSTTATVAPDFKYGAATIVAEIWHRNAPLWARTQNPDVDDFGVPVGMAQVDAMIREAFQADRPVLLA